MQRSRCQCHAATTASSAVKSLTK